MNSHTLYTCYAAELDLLGMLKHTKRDFDHVDEMCEQLYFDVERDGING